MIPDTGNQCQPQQNGVQGAPTSSNTSICQIWGGVPGQRGVGMCVLTLLRGGQGNGIWCPEVLSWALSCGGAFPRPRERSLESPDGRTDGKGPVRCVAPNLSSALFPSHLPTSSCCPSPSGTVLMGSSLTATLPPRCHPSFSHTVSLPLPLIPASLPTVHPSPGGLFYYNVICRCQPVSSSPPVAVTLCPHCHLLLSRCLSFTPSSY